MPKKAPPQKQDPQADTAHQIWLAGLGAFSQAQRKGSEALQKMLQDGLDLQRQAQQTAEQKIADATAKMSTMATQLAQGKTPLPKAVAAANPWDSLEGLFEQRVQQALTRMGWPTPQEVQALNDRVAELERQLQARPQAKGRATPAKTTRTTKPLRNG
jgi:poly(hydroxyalkanoate) granule-associated protein